MQAGKCSFWQSHSFAVLNGMHDELDRLSDNLCSTTLGRSKHGDVKRLRTLRSESRVSEATGRRRSRLEVAVRVAVLGMLRLTSQKGDVSHVLRSLMLRRVQHAGCLCCWQRRASSKRAASSNNKRASGVDPRCWGEWDTGDGHHAHVVFWKGWRRG